MDRSETSWIKVLQGKLEMPLRARLNSLVTLLSLVLWPSSQLRNLRLADGAFSNVWWWKSWIDYEFLWHFWKMKYLVWCINVTSKQLSFPRDSNIRSKNPIPISNDSQCLHIHKKKIVSTGNLACISFMFRSSWFHLKRRGSVREPGTEALSRSRSSFVSNLPPRRATCLQTPPGPFKKVAQGKSTRKKSKIMRKPNSDFLGVILSLAV